MSAAATLAGLLVLYILVGVGCVLARRRGADTGVAEALPLLLLWPLLAPFAWQAHGSTSQAGPSPAPLSGPAAALLAALRRVADSPLSPLLPDEETVRRLAGHLDGVNRRLEELDEVLLRPDFDLEAASIRRRELEVGGTRSELQAGAVLREQAIRRLRELRTRLARELDDVGELLAQLTIQVELVRFAGGVSADGRSLLRELLGRVDGLSQMLDDQGLGDTSAPARTEGSHGEHTGR